MKDQVDIYDFASINDARQKLENVVVKINKDLLYVQNVEKKEKSYVLYGIDSKNSKLEFNLKECDFSAPDLAMFYSPYYEECLMPVRATLRQFHGGLPPNHIHFISTYDNSHKSNHGNNLKIIFSDDFIKMLNNEYKTPKECLLLLKKGAKSVPFRKFHFLEKVLSGFVIYFKERPIIQFSKTGKIINDFKDDSAAVFHQNTIIPKEIEQLTECLRED